MANPATSDVSDPAAQPAGLARPAQGRGGRGPVQTVTAVAESDTGAAADHVSHADHVPGASAEADLARRLRAQNLEISQLAGGLAHEIRNPLSTLSLNLDLLAEDFRDAETPRDRRVLQRVERLKREAQRLHDILENFLRFARLQELKLAPVDLNALVEELCDFFEPQTAAQGIVLRTHFSPDLPRIALDADLFKQAVFNLLLNAEHAMSEGGELMLRTRNDGRWAVLDVTDTGVGIPEELREKIFDPFYSTRPGGSGLGLPTTRRIIEAHGGQIHVRSEPGKGSQFIIRLPNPLREPGNSTPADPQPPQTP